MSYAYPWFGMNLQTQPPLQLWNKEEEDECHKTRSTIKALTHSKWMNKSTDLKAHTNRRSFRETNEGFRHTTMSGAEGPTKC